MLKIINFFKKKHLYQANEKKKLLHLDLKLMVKDAHLMGMVIYTHNQKIANS
jgi:hypothetical protein